MKYIKQKKMFTSIATPLQKAPVALVNAPIQAFIKENPNDKFLQDLQKRIPSTTSYKRHSENALNFGLSKRSANDNGHYSIKPAEQASKIMEKRFSNSGSFKESRGIPGLEKHFQQIAPKPGKDYTDPQFYEFNLKGKTIKDMQKMAFKTQYETDPDLVDAVGKYKLWREEDLNANVSKIKNAFQGYRTRQNELEGAKHILSQRIDPEQDVMPTTKREGRQKLKELDVKGEDVIKVGKLIRKDRDQQYKDHMNDRKELKREHEEGRAELVEHIEKEKSLAKEREKKYNKLTPIQKTIDQLQKSDNPERRKEAQKHIDKIENKKANIITRAVKRAGEKNQNQKINKALEVADFFNENRLESRREIAEERDKNIRGQITPTSRAELKMAKKNKILKEEDIVSKAESRAAGRLSPGPSLLDHYEGVEESKESLADEIDDDQSFEDPQLSPEDEAELKNSTKGKRLEAQFETLKNQKKLTSEGINILLKLNKEESVGRPTAAMKPLLQKIYQAHGLPFNGNLRIKTINEQLKRWEAGYEHDREKLENDYRKLKDNFLTKKLSKPKPKQKKTLPPKRKAKASPEKSIKESGGDDGIDLFSGKSDY